MVVDTPTERHYPWHLAVGGIGTVAGVLAALGAGGVFVLISAASFVALVAWFGVDVLAERRAAGGGDTLPRTAVSVVPSTGSVVAALRSAR